MTNALLNTLRLARAGIVLSQYGIRFVPKGMKAPLVLHLARIACWPIQLLSWPFRIGQPRETRMTAALTRLGPSYIKLGQFLATRGDLIAPDLAADLAHLQDKLPPFPQAEARATVEAELGQPIASLYAEFGPPVAAASIAQVHKAVVIEDRERKAVAVKVLRPNIEKRFRRDLDSYYFAARQIERFHPPSRRLRPMAVVDNLKRTTDLEMDLRLEAAAISEMAENIAADPGTGNEAFRVPTVDWQRTTKRVLTLEWIDGTPIADHKALIAQGHDLKTLGTTVLRAFLIHAMRDGFFHADMHQGNLFVDREGRVVAVDFGIMGRLGPRERRFLAEILYGLITRDYRLASRTHFDAGYVPPQHSIETFAQALRAIGEPIHGRTAEEISMAGLLGQLFAYTEVFDMETRPELILLQKSMVIVEGVARSLDPALNIWNCSEPVAREWMEQNLGPAGRVRGAGEGATEIGRFLAEVPALLTQAARTSQALSQMAETGIRLDAETVDRLAREEARRTRGGRLALWIAALSLAAMAVVAWMGR